MNRKIYFFIILSASLFLEGRLYFIHVPKTAGTTLRSLLEMQVGVDEIYPYRNISTAKSPITQELVSGHLPFWLCKKLDPDFVNAFKITVLRDPVERYLSFLRAKKRTNHRDLESIMAEKRIPKTSYWLGLLDNAMCRFFARRFDLEGEELLQSAKEGLDQFDSVLFFDTFNRDVMDLFRRLDIPLDETDIPKLNTTVKEPISEDLRKRVIEENLWDIKLYEYAIKSFKQKDTEYKLRGSSFEAMLQKETIIDYTFDQPMNGAGWSYRIKEEPLFPANPYCRWVMDHPASIFFSLEKGRDYEISFAARFLHCKNPFKVYVNGNEAKLIENKNGSFSIYRGKIEQEWLNQTFTEISFHPQIPFSYNHCQKSQHLWISYALYWIHIN